MKDEIEIFKNNNYKFISNFVESKVSILKNDDNFNKLNLRLTNTMQELDRSLTDTQKDLFDELLQLFYSNEEYYFALAYSLGVKFGNDLKKF